MALRKITLPRDVHRYAQNNGVNVSALARSLVDTYRMNPSKELPDRGRRYRGEKPVKETSVNIDPRHAEFIDTHRLNLSRAIRETLQARMEQERALQECESGSEPISSRIDQAYIDACLRMHRA